MNYLILLDGKKQDKNHVQPPTIGHSRIHHPMIK